MFRTILSSLFLFFHLFLFGQENSITSDNTHSIFIAEENFKAIQQSLIQIDSLVTQKHSVENTCGQALVGSLCAAGFAVLPFSAVSSGLGSKDQVNAASAILTIAWYTFGAAVGVHWIAKSENPELSFWGTVGSSIIGAGVGFGFVSAVSSAFTDPPYFSAVIAALCPIISSMIYASFISEWPSDSQNIALQKNILAHKDLIEKSKLFDAELFRFNF